MFPLVSDFLATAKARFAYDPDDRHRELAFVIRKYFGNEAYPNIERALSFLSPSPLYNRQIRGEHRSILYDELVKIVVRLLGDASESEADGAVVRSAYEKGDRSARVGQILMAPSSDVQDSVEHGNGGSRGRGTNKFRGIFSSRN